MSRVTFITFTKYSLLISMVIVRYLMDPKMQFVKFYGKNHDVDSLADGIIKEIKQ